MSINYVHVYRGTYVCVCVAHAAYSRKLASVVGVRDGSQHFKQNFVRS